MDAFWLIPTGIVVVAGMAAFFAYINRRPVTPSRPNVILDKSSDEPAVDEATQNRDWHRRPSGNYMEWLAEKQK